jgi:hypothetical protein
MWSYFHHCLEYPAEVKQAHATMFGQLLQPDVLLEVREHIILSLLDRSEVKFLKISWHRLNFAGIAQ